MTTKVIDLLVDLHLGKAAVPADPVILMNDQIPALSWLKLLQSTSPIPGLLWPGTALDRRSRLR